MNEVFGRTRATPATKISGLGDGGHITLYKNHKYDFDGMLELDNAAFEDSYGDVWTPNTHDS